MDQQRIDHVCGLTIYPIFSVLKIVYFFQSLEEEEREDYLEQELWVKANFEEWKQEKEDAMRAKLAQSGKYKQYRRYMKNHGPDRMTFDDS